MAETAPPVPDSLPSADGLPSAGHIMRHKRYGGDYQADMTRCRAAVGKRVGRFTEFSQCSKPMKELRWVKDWAGNVEQLGYCATHDPVKKAERDQKRYAAQKLENEARKRIYRERERQEQSRPAYVRALQAIADGHNDPRALAIEVLTEWGDLPASVDERAERQDPQGLGPQDASAVPATPGDAQPSSQPDSSS